MELALREDCSTSSMVYSTQSTSAARDMRKSAVKSRCRRRAVAAAPFKRAAMLLAATVLVCSLVGAVQVLDVHARAEVHQYANRQLGGLQLPSVQHDRYRRQSNTTTDGGDSGGDVTTTDGGVTSPTTTTTLPPTGGSTTTTLNPPSITTTSDTTTSQTTTTTGGELSNTNTETTLPITSDTTTTTQAPITTSDTTTATSETSQNVITTIITTTLDDGSVQTTATTATPTSASDSNKDDEEPSNHKAWIIPLSVVAGIIALAGFLFLGYRCTQRRFSELDDDDGNGIRWPELMQRRDEEGTTLNPLATKRREGAGFDMDEDKSMSQLDLVGNDGMSSHGRGTPNPSHLEIFANAGLGAPAMAMARTASSGGSSNGGSAAGAGYYGAPQHAYYDPYLGASGAPYPPPPRVMSPNQQAYYDPYQDDPDYAPASPYYPPPSRNAGSNGRSSPYQGSPRAASPAIGGGSPNLAGGPVHMPMSSPYSEHQESFYPNMDRPLSSPGAAAPNAPMASPPLGPPQGQTAPRQPMRLSIANPDGLVDQ